MYEAEPAHWMDATKCGDHLPNVLKHQANGPRTERPSRPCHVQIRHTLRPRFSPMGARCVVEGTRLGNDLHPRALELA